MTVHQTNFQPEPDMLPQFVPPTDAAAIPCVRINSHRVMARMKLPTLLRLTSDPRKTEKAKERAADYQLKVAYEMRKIVQREFVGIKQRNVPKFATYLHAVQQEEIDGLAPAIKLYCASDIVVNENPDGTAVAYVALDDELVAYDGETQLAAWYSLMPNFASDLQSVYVPIDLSFGRSLTWARQVWHDVNAYGSRPNAALSLSMDNRDPLNQVADAVEEAIPFYSGQVNKLKRQVKPGEGYFTLTTFRGACVTLAKGIAGVSLGMKPVTGMRPEDVTSLEEVAIEYFTAVSETLGEAIQDPKQVANSPAVFVAIGAVGNEALKIADPEDRAAKIRGLMANLGQVNWRKGHHWNGIAGKVTTTTNPDTGQTRSRFALAGPKEASYNVFKALTDPKSPWYSQVRNLNAPGLDEVVLEQQPA